MGYLLLGPPARISPKRGGWAAESGRRGPPSEAGRTPQGYPSRSDGMGGATKWSTRSEAEGLQPAAAGLAGRAAHPPREGGMHIRSVGASAPTPTLRRSLRTA